MLRCGVRQYKNCYYKAEGNTNTGYDLSSEMPFLLRRLWAVFLGVFMIGLFRN
jgi:hypothetical protein